MVVYRQKHFNPRSPHGERRRVAGHRKDSNQISIHAPRTGSDSSCGIHVHIGVGISIHAPRTGSDPPSCGVGACGSRISIHAPRTGSDSGEAHAAAVCRISIHAPRTGSDAIEAADDLVEWAFQSTLPARGATLHSTRTPRGGDISIHAPRTGSDQDAVLDEKISGISIHAPRTGSDQSRTR